MTDLTALAGHHPHHVIAMFVTFGLGFWCSEMLRLWKPWKPSNNKYNRQRKNYKR